MNSSPYHSSEQNGHQRHHAHSPENVLDFTSSDTRGLRALRALDKRRNQVRSLEEKNRHLEAENTQLTSALREKYESVESLTQEVGGLLLTVKSLQNDLRIITTERDRYRNFAGYLGGQVQAIEERMKSLQDDYEEQSKSTSGKVLIEKAKLMGQFKIILSGLLREHEELRRKAGVFGDGYNLIPMIDVTAQNQEIMTNTEMITDYPVDNQSHTTSLVASIKNPEPVQEVQKPKTLTERALEARDRIKGLIPKKVRDAFEKHPTASRLALSGVLIGASMAGSFGVPVVGTIATTGKVALRGYGAYHAGKAVEGLVRKRMSKKLSEGETLTKEQEKSLRNVKYGSMIAAFLAGSYFDLKGLSSSFVDNVIADEGVVSIAQDVTPNTTEVISAIPEKDTVNLTEVPENIIPQNLVIDTPSQDVSVPVVITPAIEIPVGKGNHLGGIIGTSLKDILSAEQLKQLSSNGKINFIGNILKQLTPEQLHAIGVSSGDKDILRMTDKINITKLKEIVDTLNIPIKSGGFRSLFARAALE